MRSSGTGEMVHTVLLAHHQCASEVITHVLSLRRQTFKVFTNKGLSLLLLSCFSEPFLTCAFFPSESTYYFSLSSRNTKYSASVWYIRSLTSVYSTGNFPGRNARAFSSITEQRPKPRLRSQVICPGLQNHPLPSPLRFLLTGDRPTLPQTVLLASQTADFLSLSQVKLKYHKSDLLCLLGKYWWKGLSWQTFWMRLKAEPNVLLYVLNVTEGPCCLRVAWGI